MHTRNREQGLTIVEAMVTVAIVGVVAALAAPSVAKSIRGDRIKKQARVVTELFHEYRAEAAATGRAMLVLMSGTPGSSQRWHVVVPSASSACVFPVDWWNKRIYSESTTDGQDVVSVVPVDPVTGSVGFAAACIKPSGRLHAVDWAGAGFDAPISGKLNVHVDDIRHPMGTDYVVLVGINSLAKVYRP
ncbi:MAG: type II secretion system protein [Deltaproteobacteria bacterium]|nr:type II secretion system protein [Deltaproteobacteria bacterium]